MHRLYGEGRESQTVAGSLRARKAEAARRPLSLRAGPQAARRPLPPQGERSARPSWASRLTPAAAAAPYVTAARARPRPSRTSERPDSLPPPPPPRPSRSPPAGRRGRRPRPRSPPFARAPPASPAPAGRAETRAGTLLAWEGGGAGRSGTGGAGGSRREEAALLQPLALEGEVKETPIRPPAAAPQDPGRPRPSREVPVPTELPARPSDRPEQPQNGDTRHRPCGTPCPRRGAGRGRRGPAGADPGSPGGGEGSSGVGGARGGGRQRPRPAPATRPPLPPRRAGAAPRGAGRVERLPWLDCLRQSSSPHAESPVHRSRASPAARLAKVRPEKLPPRNAAALPPLTGGPRAHRHTQRGSGRAATLTAPYAAIPFVGNGRMTAQ